VFARVACALLSSAVGACGVGFEAGTGDTSDGGSYHGGGGHGASLGGGALGGAPPGPGATTTTGAGGAVPLGPFGAPQPVVELNSGAGEDDPTLTGDLLEIYFQSNRNGGLGSGDIWRATRASVVDAWSAPAFVAELSTISVETTPEIALDGLTIWVTSNVAGGPDIYRSTRATRSDAWSQPVLEAALSSSEDDYHGNISSDGLTIFISSRRGGLNVTDLFYATRPNVGAPWSVPLAIAELNTAFIETEPHSDDAQTLLYFTSDGPGQGATDIWQSTRAMPNGAWGAPSGVDELNTMYNEGDAWLAPDGKTLFMSSDRNGASELFVATR
jgi:Tol biopolymer transport system component